MRARKGSLLECIYQLIYEDNSPLNREALSLYKRAEGLYEIEGDVLKAWLRKTNLQEGCVWHGRGGLTFTLKKGHRHMIEVAAKASDASIMEVVIDILLLFDREKRAKVYLRPVRL